MREILQPSEQQLVLREGLRLHVVTPVEVAHDAVIQLRSVNRLVLAAGADGAKLRFSRRPVAQADRLARILFRVGASGQPDRAVAVLEIFLLVGLEPELVNPAIDGVSAVHGEGHNRIIHPVFVPPSCTTGFSMLRKLLILRSLAPRHGFEPRFTAPKAAVLPLDDRGSLGGNYSTSVTSAGARGGYRDAPPLTAACRAK